MKRFYKQVSLGECEAGYTVLLDGKPVKAPCGSAITARTQALADKLADEWQSQKDAINLQAMPMTRLCGGALQIGEAEREALIAEILNYSETDLLCYHAQESALQAKQLAEWEPVLKQFELAFNVRFERTVGIIPVAQPVQIAQVLRAYLEAVPPAELVALAPLVHGLGSAVLGLSVHRGLLSIDEAIEHAQLDERFQASLWGEDDASATLRAAQGNDLRHCAQYIALVRE